jgi:hypothetical protein
LPLPHLGNGPRRRHVRQKTNTPGSNYGKLGRNQVGKFDAGV